MTADQSSEIDLRIPDPLCRSWWLVLDSPIREMSREAYEAKRDEMAPWVFGQLQFLGGQEQRTILMLRQSSLTKEDRKHLLSALNNIRHCISMTMQTIADWGLMQP